MPRTRLTAASVLLLAAGVAHGQPRADVTVETRQSLGPTPYLFRNGEAINVKPLGYPLEKFVSDQKPGVFYVQGWGLDHYLKVGRSLDGLKSHTRDQTTGWDNNVEWMQAVSDHGGEIILILSTSYWLGNPGDGLAPKSLDDWERFVRDTVDLFSNQMGLRISYQVWDEPDTEMFRGSLAQYFDVVRRTVIGMKKANPEARFAGPGSSWFYGRGFKARADEKPLVYNFIRYCSRTPLPEVGLDRIPIDSLGWHVFDEEPYSSAYRQEADQARAWLQEFGYDRDTPLNISSWTRWTGLNEAEFNGSFLASSILPTLLTMEDAGIRRHVYFNLFDHWLPEAGASPESEFFSGGYGLYSRHFVMKALFNSFQALGKVEGERLRVQSTDPYLTALAASSGQTTTLLLSNFAPKDALTHLLDHGDFLQTPALKTWVSRVRQIEVSTGKRFKDALAVALQEAPDSPMKGQMQRLLDRLRSLRGQGLSLEDIVADLSARITDEGLKADFQKIGAAFGEIRRRQQQPVSVTVRANGLASQRMRYEHYVIDATHSNAYAVKDRIQAIADRMRGTTDMQQAVRVLSEINGSRAVRLDVAESGTVTVEGALSRTIELSPYSVHLIVLTAD